MVLYMFSAPSKARLAVCEAVNDANTQVCESLSKGLQQCNEKLGVNADIMNQAVNEYRAISKQLVISRAEQKETLNEAIRKFTETGDCVYPDSIRDIMFQD